MLRDLGSSISTGITNVKQLTYICSAARSECLVTNFRRHGEGVAEVQRQSQPRQTNNGSSLLELGVVQNE
jgi:hypothetical protein